MDSERIEQMLARQSPTLTARADADQSARDAYKAYCDEHGLDGSRWWDARIPASVRCAPCGGMVSASSDGRVALPCLIPGDGVEAAADEARAQEAVMPNAQVVRDMTHDEITSTWAEVIRRQDAAGYTDESPLCGICTSDELEEAFELLVSRLHNVEREAA
jgi:hypothetical protein